MQNSICKILEFMKMLDKFCLTERVTKLSDGTFETDSSHTFKLMFMVMMIYPYLQHKYDYTKLLEMALVHDIAEAETGDFPRAIQRMHPEIKKIKEEQEQAAMQKYKNILPEPVNQKIFALWQEYESKETPEAILVAALDKIDANLQANQYNNGDVRYWLDLEDGEDYFRINTEKKPLVARLNEKIVSDLEEAVINLTKENTLKCQINIKL